MLPWISPDDLHTPFPDVDLALTEPDGLLAAGGNLSPQRLLMAYQNGIFPWYSEHEPILWWSPGYRSVLFAQDIYISKRMQRTLKQGKFSFTQDHAFKEVITACALPRHKQSGTWITHEMIEAYCLMHKLGYAHSYECWLQDQLAGGIYGIRLGGIFFGESMFSKQSNASKAALIHLAQQDGIKLIDCQIHSSHLERMGAKLIDRTTFLDLIRKYTV